MNQDVKRKIATKIFKNANKHVKTRSYLQNQSLETQGLIIKNIHHKGISRITRTPNLQISKQKSKNDNKNMGKVNKNLIKYTKPLGIPRKSLNLNIT